MQARRVSERISVSPQITVGDVDEIAAQGFKAIVCNRPDGESGDQIAFAEIEAAAKAKGLEIVWQPVISGQMSDDEGKAFGEIMERLPGPVLAYCRSGTRCIMLWALSQAGCQPTPEILKQAADAGYDLSALAPRIEQLARQ